MRGRGGKAAGDGPIDARSAGHEDARSEHVTVRTPGELGMPRLSFRGHEIPYVALGWLRGQTMLGTPASGRLLLRPETTRTTHHQTP